MRNGQSSARSGRQLIGCPTHKNRRARIRQKPFQALDYLNVINTRDDLGAPLD